MTPPYPTDLEIARRARLQPIGKIAEKIGISGGELECYGHFKAKISRDPQAATESTQQGKLVLVTAVSPTPAGEGKTTTSVGLADALSRIGKKTVLCLREPSLGPCFGIKGGAAGGGYAQVVPMEEINLHFTGDLHAISTVHNLLAALVDNHIHHGNHLGFDVRRATWNRVVDLNDRALRHAVLGLGGFANGFPRESGFDITVASEVMAILCLSRSIFDLKERLGRIIVGWTRSNTPVTAADLHAHGAMAALLKDAIKPNLVQTLEGNPALIHGGPFANIAHGCNSIGATRLALELAEYTITEAGFGADLGAEKFFDIKCRQAGLRPDVVVLVATVRALKYHGGADLETLTVPNPGVLALGLDNLGKHIENLRRFGLPVVVAVNSFPSDTEEEIRVIVDYCETKNVTAVRADHWARGGQGAEELARQVVRTAEENTADFTPLYPDSMPLIEKVETVCREIYGADGIVADKKVRSKFEHFEHLGFGHFPVCMAKTQYSFSADPALRGRPSGFTIPIRDVRVSAGAGFVVVLTGEIMTMPGLPKVPAAQHIDIDEQGNISGLS